MDAEPMLGGDLKLCHVSVVLAGIGEVLGAICWPISEALHLANVSAV